MARGEVALESVSGTGGSSGTVLEGQLVSQSRASLEIDVWLSVPMYFRNSGRGQNMVATQLYGRDGSYLSDGEREFIRVAPGARLPIIFVAYCADFDKENPTAAEVFAVAPMWAEIDLVMRRIAAYERAHSEVETTVAAQLALWVAQELGLEDIRQKFAFTAADVAMMEEMLRTDPGLGEAPDTSAGPGSSVSP